MSNAEATNKRDLAANRLHRILIWGVPFAALIGLNFTAELLQPNERVEIAAVLFLWMGAACSLNALRCRRLHCMIAGPAFLIGAALLPWWHSAWLISGNTVQASSSGSRLG